MSTPPATLSAAASTRLELELAALVEERSLRATEPIDASGDAADLAEFAARDMVLEQLDSRIAGIRGLLAEVSVPRPRAAAPATGAAVPGTVVELRFAGDRTVETYLLGHLAEAGGEHEVLTTDSPLGRALLGVTAGTTVHVAAPRGELDVTLVGVRAA